MKKPGRFSARRRHRLVPLFFLAGTFVFVMQKQKTLVANFSPPAIDRVDYNNAVDRVTASPVQSFDNVSSASGLHNLSIIGKDGLHATKRNETDVPVEKNTDPSVGDPRHVPDQAFPGSPELPTFAMKPFAQVGMGHFNQHMAFSGAMMILDDRDAKAGANRSQLLASSLAFLDYLGTNESVDFSRLFDVAHWNSHFPALPRIVAEDRTERHDLFPRPPQYAHPFWAFAHYEGYLNAFKKHKQALHRVDALILGGALRPAPAVQAAIDRIAGNYSDYMAIHLRVEQDYLCHWGNVRDRNLTTLLAHIETSLGPEPPAPRVYFAINRRLLEDATWRHPAPKPSARVCYAERDANLRALNRAVREGLWGGRARVFERPPFSADDAALRELGDRPVAFGSLIDAELCARAKIFVGRFSSTYTKNVV